MSVTGAEQSKAKEELETPFPLTATDRFNLTQTDDEFEPHSWEGIKEIIGTSCFLPVGIKPIVQVHKIGTIPSLTYRLAPHIYQLHDPHQY